MDEATGSKVDNFNLGSGIALDEDILWLQVAMNELEIVDVGECSQNLLSNLLETGNCEVSFLFCFTVVLAVFVQVVPQQLCHDKQMLLVVEEIDQS